MPYKQKYTSVAKMKSPYAKLGHSDSVAMQTNPKKGEELNEVVVAGDASKIGAFGNQLDKAFQSIRNTISSGGFSGSQGQAEAGLGYGTDASKELARLEKMKETEGAPYTLRYMRKRSRDVDGGTIPSFLSMPKSSS
jgi:hypothetical protein